MPDIFEEVVADAERAGHDIHDLFHKTPLPSATTTPEAPMTTTASPVDGILADVEAALNGHRPEIEKALTDSARLASSPLAQAGLEAVHLPPELASIFAEAITAADAHLAQAQQAQAKAEAERDAALTPPADPAAPATTPDPDSTQPENSGESSDPAETPQA